jgi:hypothetical protein
MKDYCQDNARNQEICSSRNGGDVQVAEFVVFLIVRRHQRTKYAKNRQSHEKQAQHFNLKMKKE